MHFVSFHLDTQDKYHVFVLNIAIKHTINCTLQFSIRNVIPRKTGVIFFTDADCILIPDGVIRS